MRMAWARRAAAGMLSDRDAWHGLTLGVGAAAEDGAFLEGDGAEETVEEGEPRGAAVRCGRRLEHAQVLRVGEDGREQGVCTGPVLCAVRGAERERGVEAADRVHGGGGEWGVTGE